MLLENEDGVADGNDAPAMAKKARRNAKSQDIHTGLPFAIKVMQLCNAAGESGRACIIVAIKTMQSEDFFSFLVSGLSWTGEIGGSGYVYFCKTRCGTKEM